MKRNRNGDGTIVAPSGPTIEFTNLPAQILGAIIPPLIMVFLRCIILLICVMIILCIGEQAPAIIMIVLCCKMWIDQNIGIVKGDNFTLAVTAISSVLSILAFTDYWPDVLIWKRIDSQMHYRLHWDFESRWISWLSVDTGLVPATPGILWFRAIIILIVPIILLKGRVINFLHKKIINYIFL